MKPAVGGAVPPLRPRNGKLRWRPEGRIGPIWLLRRPRLPL